MDFVVGLSRTQKGHDSNWVVDRLTKSAHVLLVRTTYDATQLDKSFGSRDSEITWVPINIILDRDPKFTSKFWKYFNKAIGTRLNLSTKYHPQIDGQTKRTIHTLEDML